MVNARNFGGEEYGAEKKIQEKHKNTKSENSEWNEFSIFTKGIFNYLSIIFLRFLRRVNLNWFRK